MADRIKVGVVGVGDFGRHHVRLYRELDGAELVGVCDADTARARTIAQEFSTHTFDSLSALAESAQAVSVAVPTQHHAGVAGELLQRGCDVLVEKPIAASLAEADELVRTAEAGGRILQVGHTERFNPAVVAAAGVVTQPLFFEVHRLGVFSGRSLDVDVIFDLMIHDLDILLSFVPQRVEQVHAVGIPILSSKVDIASVRLEFANGCVANLTASRVSTEKVRKLRFFQPHTYVSIDFTRQDVLMISLDPAKATGAASPLGLPAGLSICKLETKPEEPLRAELRSFLEAVRTRRPGPADGRDGRRALALAEQVAEAIAAHAHKLPPSVVPAPATK
ncbi:MAG TPA: Gfo/Idh/MocA family oxidoreductase [Candidatus Xenobia bacterium]|nr:Gfo/Idh/MocA family oxidoreductase [Candidatus Xenobia bacterium]